MSDSELNDNDKLKEISSLQTELEAARQQIALLEEELPIKQLKGNMHSNGLNNNHK